MGAISNLGFKIHTAQLSGVTDNTGDLAPTDIKFATFNLFNYLEPPNAFYEFERIYTAEQWAKKQRWITNYLSEYQPDIIGFQEVFSIESLQTLVAAQGYPYFAVIDQPEVIDGFIYKSPVVAIASRFAIVETAAVMPDSEIVALLGLVAGFSFSRQILRATIDVPHIGHTDCYVVHFKSKRSMLEFDQYNTEYSAQKAIIEGLKSQLAGGWASTIQRGSEATLLMIDMIVRREATQLPMVLMGDFNNNLSDGVLSHLLTNTLRFVLHGEQTAHLAKYCLSDAWDLYQKGRANDAAKLGVNDEKASNSVIEPRTDLFRTPTHYFGATHSVLDYILLSCEFDAGYQGSFFQVSNYHTADRHLINPLFERDDQSTDHGVVLVTLTLRR